MTKDRRGVTQSPNSIRVKLTPERRHILYHHVQLSLRSASQRTNEGKLIVGNMNILFARRQFASKFIHALRAKVIVTQQF